MRGGGRDTGKIQAWTVSKVGSDWLLKLVHIERLQGFVSVCMTGLVGVLVNDHDWLLRLLAFIVAIEAGACYDLILQGSDWVCFGVVS